MTTFIDNLQGGDPNLKARLPQDAQNVASAGFTSASQNAGSTSGSTPNGNLVYGSSPERFNTMYNTGLGHLNSASTMGNTYANRSLTNRGPQSIEDQNLSNNEAQTRGYDQGGALGLARNAAMGNAPSEAAYQMQRGLDTSLANQQAVAGGARGAGGIALAGSNMAANTASLQNQAYGQAAQLRAGEMAQARDQYGGLATNMRGQDLQRLGQSTQNSQFNATNRDANAANMGQIGLGYSNAANGWYGNTMHPLDQQADMDTSMYDTSDNDYQRALDRQAGMYNSRETALTERQKNGTNALLTFTGGLMGTAGKALGA